jgi:hypothetical protein
MIVEMIVKFELKILNETCYKDTRNVRANSHYFTARAR